MHNFKLNQHVIFGRENGEKTQGIIIKLNSKTAKIKTLEGRGYRSEPTIWRVAYSLIEPYNGSDKLARNPIVVEKIVNEKNIEYNPFDENNSLIEELLSAYISLSPENLSCDGELPQYVTNMLRKRIEKRIKGLQIAIGEDLTEDQCYQWSQSKFDYIKQNPAAFLSLSMSK